jgi:hypothetical protein
LGGLGVDRRIILKSNVMIENENVDWIRTTEANDLVAADIETVKNFPFS